MSRIGELAKPIAQQAKSVERESFPIFFGRNWIPRARSSLHKFGDGVQTPLHLTALVIKHQMHANFPMQSTTSVTMTFTSKHHAVLEGALEFCLPPRATVVGYALDIDGQLVDGVVVDKQQARIAFEKEVRKGVDPGLVEIVQGNIFRTRVYPMMPNASRTVQIRYQDSSEIAQGAEGDVLSSFPVLFQEPLAHLQIEVELLGANLETEPRFSEYQFDANVPKFDKTAAGFRFEHSYFDVKPTEDGLLGASAISILLPKAAANATMLAIEKDPVEADLSYFALSYRPPRPQLVAQPIRREVASVFQRLPPLEICVLFDASLSRSGGVQTHARKMEISALEAILKFHLQQTKVDIHLSIILFRHIAEAPVAFELRFDADVSQAWKEVDEFLQAIEYDGATNLQGLKKAVSENAPQAGAANAAFYLFTDGLSTFSSGGASEEASSSIAFHTLFAPFPAPVYCFNASPSTSGANARLLRHLADSSGGLVLDSAKIESLLAPGGSEVEELARSMASPRWGFKSYVAKRAAAPANREGEDVIMAEPGVREEGWEFVAPVEDEFEEENIAPEGLKVLAAAALPPKPKKVHPAGLSDLFPFSSTTLTDGRILVVGKLRGNQTQELTLLFGGADSAPDHEKTFLLDPKISSAPTGLIRRLLGSEKLAHYSLFPSLFSTQIREIGLKYSLVGEGSSLIVLETLAQHIEHKIAPPASRPKLYQGWLVHQAAKQNERVTNIKDKIKRVEGYFSERSRWYDRSIELGSKKQAAQKQEERNKKGGGDGFGGGGPPGERQLATLASRRSAPAAAMSFGAPPPPMAGSAKVMSRNSAMAAPASSGGGGGAEKDKRSGAGGDDEPSGPSIVIQAYDSKQPYMKTIKAASSMQEAYSAYLVQRDAFRSSPSFFFDVSSFFLSPPAEFTRKIKADAPAAAAAAAAAEGEKAAPAAASASGGKGSAPPPPAGQVPKRGFFASLFGSGKTPIPKKANEAQSAHYQSSKKHGANPIGRAFGIRILSNIVELQLNEPQLLRICAYKLQEFGELDLALEVFSLIKALRPDEPQSFRDLALCLEEMGRYELAAALLNQVLIGSWDHRFDEIEVTAAHELNNMLLAPHDGRKERYQAFKARFFALPEGIPANLHPGAISTAIPPSPALTRFMPCDLRICMVWDTNDTDVDLHVHEPSGEEVYYGNRNSRVGGMISRDFRQGYGPEEYLIAKAPFGTYKVSAKYFANHQQSLVGATTLMVHCWHYWGSPHCEKEVVTLRLATNQDIVPVCEIKHGPPVKKETLQSVQAELAEARAHIDTLEKQVEQLTQQLQAKPSPNFVGPAVVPISASTVHNDVGCDGCGTAPLRGSRYKCMICPNADACEACKDKPLQSVPGHSPAHPMIRFTDSRPFAQSPIAWNRENYVHQVACTLCFQQPIVGYRYHCETCGIDHCESCELSGRHDLTHTRTKILSPQ